MARLMAGSEGTLGIITKISVRLLPLPRASKTMMVIFEDMVAGDVGELVLLDQPFQGLELPSEWQVHFVAYGIRLNFQYRHC